MSARPYRCWLASPGLWGAALGVCVLGCLRPSEDRARQDQEVGSADDGQMSVEVEGGHAVVRQLDTGSLSLWASAPRLSFDVRFLGAPPDELRVSIHNCMPDAQLSGPVPVLEQGRDATGVCWFRLGPLAGRTTLGLRVAPPDSERARPFRFAVMSDVQEAIDGVQDIYDVLNLEPDVDFLLGAGDLTEQGTAEELERFQRELESLRIPYYTTLGNHELGQSPTLYHQYFGRGSQSFAYNGMRFTLIDSASATLDPIVFDWLHDWLVLGVDQLHVVAMHIPPLDPIGVRNGAFASRNEAAKLLGRLATAGVDLTLYGHIHSYYHFDNAGIPAFISGGGGAIPEKFDDIGRHFLVVDADPIAQTFQVRVVRVD
jgi:3',5'-cyclic-AMP phosphodiesterase